MGSFSAAVALVLAASAAPALPAPGGAFRDDFSSYPAGDCLPEGSRLGPWSVVFGRSGCARVEELAGGRALHQSALPSARPGTTHALLLTGPWFASPLRFSARVQTLGQLRQNTRANSWEVAWLVWDYADRRRFYYFIPRDDGWELGKRDPAFRGGQRYLASGSEPSFPLGAWTEIRVEQDGPRLAIYAAGRLVIRVTDRSSPYLAGRVGLYSEDAHAHFAEIAAGPLP